MKIPAFQSGLFKDVRARLDAAALLVVTPPEGRTPIVITSLNFIDSTTGRRSADAGAAHLNTDGADEEARRVVTVAGTDVDGNAYVIVRAGARLSDLSFEIRTSCVSGKLMGIPESAGAEVAVSGGVYHIGPEGWHDYIVAGGRKWATMNIGATSRKGRESFGHFFSWGNVIGYSFSGVDWKVARGYPGEGAVLEDGFTAENYVSSRGSRLSVLPLAADAAYVNWGGAWRMPTAAEFESLLRSSGTTEKDFRLASTGLYDGSYVGGHYLRIRGTRLRFPFSGRGDFAWWDYRGSGWNVNESFEDYGGYLSSTGSPRNPDSARIMSFRYGFDGHDYSRELCACTEDLRHLGHCVRAVAE
ncbi:MAG: hypothetical protein KBS72_04995 [Bacteroidales bacterium]|nr:hypothetical protein [Candidatus Cacconaster scatequi]